MHRINMTETWKRFSPLISNKRSSSCLQQPKSHPAWKMIKAHTKELGPSNRWFYWKWFLRAIWSSVLQKMRSVFQRWDWIKGCEASIYYLSILSQLWEPEQLKDSEMEAVVFLLLQFTGFISRKHSCFSNRKGQNVNHHEWLSAGQVNHSPDFFFFKPQLSTPGERNQVSFPARAFSKGSLGGGKKPSLRLREWKSCVDVTKRKLFPPTLIWCTKSKQVMLN